MSRGHVGSDYRAAGLAAGIVRGLHRVHLCSAASHDEWRRQDLRLVSLRADRVNVSLVEAV